MGWIKKQKMFLRKHRVVVTIVVIVAALVLIGFGTKLYLALNLLLGNDVVVQLETDKGHIYLTQGEAAGLAVKARFLTNPFCTATCNATLTDTKNTLAEQAFTIRPGDPFEQEYTIRAPEHGHGLKTYRVSMACVSKRTFLCHTKEEPVRRDALVTLWYDLSPENAALQARLRTELGTLANGIMALNATVEAAAATAKSLTTVLMDEDAIRELQNHTAHLSRERSALQPYWQREEYTILENRTSTLYAVVATAAEEAAREAANIAAVTNEYNDLVDDLESVRTALANLTTADVALAERINNTIDELNAIARQFARRDSLTAKHNIVSAITNEAQQVLHAFSEERRMLAERVNTTSTALCRLGTCTTYDTSTLAAACAAMTLADEAWRATNENITVWEHLTSNATPPAPCTIQPVKEPAPVSAPRGTILAPATRETNDVIADPPGMCCALGTCEPCCDDCPEQNYPVVFLHGHAFNKDTLAEYSLHGFTTLQTRLEQDGYLNAGTVSLHTTTEAPGVLGKLNTPITLKVSYYFDVFVEPENHVTVQTKSENIDTYAVRLKELVDTVLHKTGKDNVIIVAHSMGGLVARRYLQIFSEAHVEKLVIIATPNNGIVGNVADYCPFVGERLECRDMNADSLFMNKLNRQLSSIPTYTIIGTGCRMNGEDGDGVVLSARAKLPGATNIHVNGTCSRFSTLHTELLQMPEVYRLVREALD